MKNQLLILLFSLFTTLVSHAQQLPHPDSVEMLITNTAIQIECTEAMNNLYNFKFKRAESVFQWLRRTYPEHPLSYFLMGLSQWWKIVPNVDNQKYDKKLLAYMDSSIYFAKQRYKSETGEAKVEAAFFLAAAYGFRGRIHSERKHWRKAAGAGKKALKYMEEASDQSELSPEFLFGDGLYNYYSVWIPENYKYLKPILWFFKKGDKEKGLKQLEEVSRNAFYTRTEAQFFLMRILSNEGQQHKAFPLAQELHRQYPDNPFFHRYYARMLYMRGKTAELEGVCLSIIERIDKKQTGYEEISGRYAAFFLGSIYKRYLKDDQNAIKYLDKAVGYAEKIKATTSGYYLHSLAYLAQIHDKQDNMTLAIYNYNKILDTRQKKHSTYKEAKAYLKKIKRKKRKK